MTSKHNRHKPHSVSMTTPRSVPTTETMRQGLRTASALYHRSTSGAYVLHVNSAKVTRVEMKCETSSIIIKTLFLPDRRSVPISSRCRTDSVASVCLGASSCCSKRNKDSYQIKCAQFIQHPFVQHLLLLVFSVISFSLSTTMEQFQNLQNHTFTFDVKSVHYLPEAQMTQFYICCWLLSGNICPKMKVVTKVVATSNNKQIFLRSALMFSFKVFRFTFNFITFLKQASQFLLNYVCKYLNTVTITMPQIRRLVIVRSSHQRPPSFWHRLTQKTFYLLFHYELSVSTQSTVLARLFPNSNGLKADCFIQSLLNDLEPNTGVCV